MWLLVTKPSESDQSRNVHVAAVNASYLHQQQSALHTVPGSELQDIMHEYKDCFPESLPEGLPVERDVAHTNPTEAVVAPPYRPVYRLSPAENAEFSVRFQMDSRGASLSQVFHHAGRLCSLSERRMVVCACALTTEH